ncbi:DedA family protein [Brevibacillus composti]|uniref:DedA family protein n=1 Tax=Brevibacillus composti TaxID=2796470 RepID=A0A7T5EN70_9BACL|nr:DedA family protein [Brevibacillus composti]QQE75636.1 DedA family protein [Brevibacillus composti]QUO42662.1 DedA family protein [Brevibacillus composti]
MEEIAASLGNYISQYGYGALFGLFFLGILGMPLPEETLLVFSGFLVSTGKLELFPTFLVCFLGSISAMTTAYWIGRTLGFSFIERYGRRFGLGYTLYQKTEDWFNRVGKWALPLGYFIPGVRQFTAYFAGITRLPFPTFMLYTYSGGLFWSILFVTLGWQLGERWDELFGLISRNLAIFFLVLLAAIAAWSFWRTRRSKLNQRRNRP